MFPEGIFAHCLIVYCSSISKSLAFFELPPQIPEDVYFGAINMNACMHLGHCPPPDPLVT